MQTRPVADKLRAMAAAPPIAPIAPMLRPPLWPWVMVSLIVHASIVLFGIAGRGLIAGEGVASGNGYSGTSIEVEIAGPEDGPPRGAVPTASVEDPPPAPVAASSDDTPEPELVVEDEGEVEVAAVSQTHEPREARQEHPGAESPVQGPAEEAPPTLASGRAPTQAEGAPDTEIAASPGENEDAAGTGSDDSTAGEAPGELGRLILGSAGVGGNSITTRHALLENGGMCTDPVAGTWRAQKYRAGDRTWVRFVLRVRREEGAGLSGTITSRIWTGRPGSAAPGPCTAFGMDHTWRMQARGRIEGERLTFGARGGARLIRQDCPRSDASYAPDQFRGTVHVFREVFESVNNDGAFDLDEPYTFRRVSCGAD